MIEVGEVVWPDPPDASVVGTIDRKPGSIRRTASIKMAYPGGPDAPLELHGSSRDLLTRGDGSAAVLGEAGMIATIGENRTVSAITVWPETPPIAALVGARGGNAFRSAIDAVLPGERESASPLYFLLDDIAGVSLIAGFAWSRSQPDWLIKSRGNEVRAEPIGFRKGRVICSGLRPGGYHELRRAAQDPHPHFLRRAGNLDSVDPLAWHEIEPPEAVSMRRRRRVDIRPTQQTLEVDAHFRDSVWDLDGTELALHEYTLEAQVDRVTHQIVSIIAKPKVLPFPECPAAARHVEKLVGMSVDRFRTSVQETLRELEACTHLNDMLRCLGEVSALASAVDR